ncbi:MAG: hypothetical protein ACOH1E_02945 [Brevundimonas sp.]
MSHKARPEEQTRFADPRPPAAGDGAQSDRRGVTHGIPMRQPDPDILGRFGDLKQSLTNRWQVQDR